MKFGNSIKTVTVGAKGQITIPAVTRKRLDIKGGERFDVFALPNDRLIAVLRRPSRILEYLDA